MRGEGSVDERDERSALRRRRAAVVAVLVALVALLAVLCWHGLPELYSWLSDASAVRALVAEHPVLSRLALGGVNVLQIVCAFLPGEPIELACGYAFGFVEGTLVCLAASAVASGAIFLAVRRWGWSLVGLFFDRSHLDRILESSAGDYKMFNVENGEIKEAAHV